MPTLPRHRPLTHSAILCIGAVLPLLPLLSQAKMAPAEDRLYGGLYANNCSDPSQIRVRLYGDVMSVEQAGKTVAASRFKAAPGHLGTKAPADFKTAYVGNVKGGDGLVFVLQHNANGLFVTLEGGARSLATLGPGVQGQKLRHCDPNRNALPGATAAAAAAPAAPSQPSDLLKDPRFKAAYLKALGPLAQEPWLAALNGPAPQLRKVQAGGTEQWLAAPCKPHDCADNNLLLLYAAGSGTVVGKVFQRGGSTLIGNPSPALVTELDRLWAAEFRR